MTEYVRPPAFTAHRVIRAMTKVCASHDIGIEGFALVSLIAHQWDAVRYAKPIGYHLTTIMNLLGILSKQKFYRIEKRCLAAGWLMRRNQGTRLPVLYWVAIPPHAQEVGDGVVMDSSPQIGTNAEPNCGTNTGTNSGPESDLNRNQSGTQTGPPSPLSPSPSPSPSPSAGDIDLDGIDKPAQPDDLPLTADSPRGRAHLALLRTLGVSWSKDRLEDRDAILLLVKNHSAKLVGEAAKACSMRHPEDPTWLEELRAEIHQRKQGTGEARASASARVAQQAQGDPVPVIIDHFGGWQKLAELLRVSEVVTDAARMRMFLEENHPARKDLIDRIVKENPAVAAALAAGKAS